MKVPDFMPKRIIQATEIKKVKRKILAPVGGILKPPIFFAKLANRAKTRHNKL